MTLLELARKHDQLADMYERAGEDPLVDYRATVAALRLLHEREVYVSYVVSESSEVSRLRREMYRLLKGKQE